MREKKKRKSAKRQVRDHHPFENKADINTEQPQAGAQESRQESLQGHKWSGDHRGKAESNLLPLLETLFALSLVVFSTFLIPNQSKPTVKAKLPQIYAAFSIS